MDSLAFLERGGGKLHAVYVLHGDEDFLKRQALAALRALVFGPEGNDFGLSTHRGDTATFAAIHDELQTLPFLTPRRLVVVDNADPFVTAHRAALEKYLAAPASTGVLVLDVKTWPSTTRLYRLVDRGANISCKAPAAYRLPDWCVQWAASRHGKQLAAAAASLLVDLVGTDMGQLDQELAKLAIYAGTSPHIEAADVDRLVGSSRAENIFKIFDAIANGRPGQALAILDHLFDQAEEPIRILGAFSWQLRRLAQAARLRQQGLSSYAALEQAGVPAYSRQAVEQHLRSLGPERTDRLYDWLLEADLGLKGSSQLPPRTLLERLVVRLCQAAEKGVGQRL
ncbi:MAG TPA: DNA polymerase III subunit delta [Gemmataceae bacterium]|jgi:DNA polymerase-3 subunit delta|nr:DNA polymerase III subunit delta [Gemmataceae bacterium]